MAYCERCERHFSSSRALWQHQEDSSKHFVCRSCDKDFIEMIRLKQHYTQSPRHDYCQLCDEHFDTDDELEEHRLEEHYYCRNCRLAFDTDIGLHEHNCRAHEEVYCDPCRRIFRNENCLKFHLNSSVHQPKTVRCPGAGCGRSFVSLSALLLHFEAGTCASGLTREQLNRMAVRMDRNNVVTNPSKLICGPDGYAPATVTQNWATERSWNGSAYECFLCNNTFRMLRALNTHLQSPRHQEKIYRCPNRRSCGVEFTVLSGLTQHVESGKCGVKRFKEVQSTLDSLVTGVRMLTV